MDSNAEGDRNLIPGGGTISLGESNMDCYQKSTCAVPDISADEEDLKNRLHNLLGDRWPLIAGRLPWRRMEEIVTYCKMRYSASASSSGS